MSPLETMALAGAAGFGLYLLFGSDKSRSLATSGRVSLEARVPYRIELQTDAPLTSQPMTASTLDKQTTVRGELIKFSAYDIAFGRTPGRAGGEYSVWFTMVPPAPVPFAIGAQLDEAGEFGPGLRLFSVERLDGKSIV
jgi:hypothetical protein